MKPFHVCLCARLALCLAIAAAFASRFSRAIGVVLSLVAAMLFVRKFHTYEQGQMASFNKTIQVSWNSLRPMHILSMVLLALAFARDDVVIGVSSFAVATALAMYAHEPKGV